MNPEDDDERTRIVPAPVPPAGDTSNALPMGTFLGEFELIEFIGEGGFSIVYLAQDHSLRRRVALKEYIPAALAVRGSGTQVTVKSERHRETFEAGLKSFVNEARLLAQFDHPSLVKVYRFWEANGTAYLVMPFYEGVTLKDKLRQMLAPPDEPWLLGLLAPLTEALAVIHAEKCFHRDIAPDNVILLAGSGKPLLLDFGAARRVIGDMTQALTVILKPGYAPVEQYAEVPEMKQGPWTDVYALAASVYFAIVGKTPPPSVGRLMSDSYVPMLQAGAGRYSERFLRAIDHALRVRPEERTQDIEAFRAELGLGAPAGAPTAPALSAVRPAPARPIEAAAGSPPNRSRRGLWLGGGAALLAGGFGVAMVKLLSPPTEAGLPGTVPPPPLPQPASTPAVASATPTASPAMSPPTPARDLLGEFDAIVRLQRPGYEVGLSVATPRLRIGSDDELSLSVTSRQAGLLYVLLLDETGDCWLIVPTTLDDEIRIRAGQRLEPPQLVKRKAGEQRGSLRLLAIVSRHALDFSPLVTSTEVSWRKLGRAAAVAAETPAGSPSRLLGSPADAADYGAALLEVPIV